ncbi:MAG: DUF4194 domain-containing protein [Cyanobacteria bacterium REEB67]|nr:DUF4194 domain-containing protein [Cyanobacteria bacterium REEB67]
MKDLPDLEDYQEEIPGSNTAVQALVEPNLTNLVVGLLKGVIYQENDGPTWSTLLKLQARVRDYVAVIGLELILDEAEGYAFLRAKTQTTDDVIEGVEPIQRLVARRPLSFPVSLTLALLRKKLAEFDARGGESRLVLSKDDVLEMMKVFLPEGSNEVKLVTQIDATLNKIVDLGFLRRLKGQSSRQDNFEVRRILKAFVDAQWLSDFDERLAQYQQKLADGAGDD